MLEKDIAHLEMEEEEFDTVIAADISFSGKIRFVKPLMIKGKMNGTIDATSDLLIDEGAMVVADITADRVLVKGTVQGNITCTKMVYVTGTGSVTGDITSAQVVLEPGSQFSGRCNMTRGGGAA